MNEIGLKKGDLDTPILWVDLDLLEANIKTLAAHFQAAGKAWRPHTKGIKIPAIAHLCIDAGAMGVTCAKLGEAEVMAAGGVREILIANQIVGPIKVARLANLCRSANLIVCVDHEDNVVELGQVGVDKGIEFRVLVDVDTGMGRSGRLPGADALSLAKFVDQTDGVAFKGLMAWEGHTTKMAGGLKQAEVEKSVNLLTDTAELCRREGLNVSIVSGGGSGTYQITPFLPGLTEIQAGGAIFSDVSYEAMGVETTQCLFVQAQVTSRPASDRLVIDAGFKALPTWAAVPKPLGIGAVEAYRASAEHGGIRLSAENDEIKIGDKIDLVVGYTDATLFLHDHLYGIRNDKVELVWEIAGRGKLR